jgi:hypothetical protein
MPTWWSQQIPIERFRSPGVKLEGGKKEKSKWASLEYVNILNQVGPLWIKISKSYDILKECCLIII